jgi:hypothetical protein
MGAIVALAQLHAACNELSGPTPGNQSISRPSSRTNAPALRVMLMGPLLSFPLKALDEAMAHYGFMCTRPQLV